MAASIMAASRYNNDHNSSLDEDGTLTLQDAVLNEVTKVVSPVGLLTNVVFLYAVLRVRAMRSIIYIYLVSLAVADTSFLALSLSSIWLSHPLSNILFSCLPTFQMASFCFITALAVDRYFAVTTPIKFRARATKARAGKISVGLWGVALGAGVSYYLIRNLSDHTELAVSVLTLIVHGAVLFMNTALYVSIVKTVDYPTSSCRASPIRGNRILSIVVLNTFVFFLYNLMAFISSAVTFLYGVFDGPHQDSHKGVIYLRRCVSILYLISCSIDPIIYSVANADRRAAFLKTFSCRLVFCCCRRGTVRKKLNQKIDLKVLHPLLEPGDPVLGQVDSSGPESAKAGPDASSSNAKAGSATSPTLPGIEPLPHTSQGPVYILEVEHPTNHQKAATCSFLGRPVGACRPVTLKVDSMP